MPKIRTLERSFAGGEVTREMYGRLDLAQYQTGLSLSRNFITRPHGPAMNRPGLAYVLEAGDSTHPVRLIPFSYSITQTMVLEFGHFYVRFHTQGGTLLEAAKTITGVTNASPGVVTIAGHGFANGDVVQLQGVGGMPALTGRFCKVASVTTNTFALTDFWGNPIDTTGFAAFTTGGTAARVYTLVTPYDSADIFALDYAQSNDVMTLTHTAHAPRELSRLGATNWTLSVISFEPSVPVPDAGASVVVNGSGSLQYRYAVSAVDMADNQESTLCILNSGIGFFTITAANPAVFSGITHNLNVGDFVQVQFVVSGKQGDWQVNTVPSPTTFTVIDADGNVFDNTTAGETGASVQRETFYNDLTVGTNNNVLSWTTPFAIPGHTYRFNVYAFSRGLWGFIGQTTLMTFTDNNITPDVGNGPPNPYSLFVGAGNYPACVAYFEQRKIFAGWPNSSQSIAMTRVGTEANLCYSIPSKDDDAIVFAVANLQSMGIRHIVPGAELLMLASDSEWRVTSLNSDAITPTSISVRVQTKIGSSQVKPQSAQFQTLYAQARGGRIRELVFGYAAFTVTPTAGYLSNDICLNAPHLFDFWSISDMSLVKFPYQILWAVRSDGTLLGCSYVPEQRVTGWHQHTTAGSFESVCQVAEGNQDVLYAVVNRTVNGRTVRYIEQMQNRLLQQLTDSFFVDSGVAYSGSPATVFSGLWHLEGQSVAILADGAVVAPQVVSGGRITLGEAASKVVVGLPYVAQMQTLPWSAQIDAAEGSGVNKNVNKVWLRLDKAVGAKAGPDFNSLTLPPPRTDEAFGAPPDWFNGVVEVVIDGYWNPDGVVCVQQDAPLPVTVESIAMEVALGG